MYCNMAPQQMTKHPKRPRRPRHGCELAAIARMETTRIAACPDERNLGLVLPHAGRGTGNAYEYQALLNCGWPPLGPCSGASPGGTFGARLAA